MKDVYQIPVGIKRIIRDKNGMVKDDNGHSGVLDEVLMWNRVLTSDERAELFALTTPLL